MKRRHEIMPGLWYEAGSDGTKRIYAMVDGAPWELEVLDPGQPIHSARLVTLLAEVVADPGTE